LYSDGFRNAILHLLPVGVLIYRLIYFGYILSEENLENNLGDSSKTILREVVSFKSIQDTWKRILSDNSIHFTQVFDQGDLLIVMRYWGDENYVYQFKETKSILDYLIAEIENVPCERIILKSHPWFKLAFDVSLLEGALGKKVISWENFLSVSGEHSELLSPEALMWDSKEWPEYLFAFDSSLNVLSAQNWKSTKIIFPRRACYENYFANSLSISFVNEQISWISEVINWITYRPDTTLHLSIDGRLSEKFLLNMILREYKLKVDNLRDELTQERDELTQERDELTNSTFWRATRFMRALISFARRIKGRSI